MVLTLDVEDDSLGDGGRHAVGGDTQVGAHLGAADARQVELVAVVHVGCNTQHCPYSEARQPRAGTRIATAALCAFLEVSNPSYQLVLTHC